MLGYPHHSSIFDFFFPTPMATSKSPTCGRVKIPHLRWVPPPSDKAQWVYRYWIERSITFCFFIQCFQFTFNRRDGGLLEPVASSSGHIAIIHVWNFNKWRLKIVELWISLCSIFLIWQNSLFDVGRSMFDVRRSSVSFLIRLAVFSGQRRRLWVTIGI